MGNLNPNIKGAKQTKGTKKPNDQNNNNGYIKKIFNPALHRDKTIDSPKDKPNDYQNYDNSN